MFYPLGQLNKQLCQYDRAPSDFHTLVCQVEGDGYLIIEICQPLLAY